VRIVVWLVGPFRHWGPPTCVRTRQKPYPQHYRIRKLSL
jgi:hypothetical protein